MKLNLLIVEDDSKISDLWDQKLELYNVEEDSVYDIQHRNVTKLSEAQRILENTKFDAAVIDIRLDDNGTQTDDGNAILESISENSLSVCAVYTGEPDSAKVAEHQKEFVEVFEKGDGEGIDKILIWLNEKADMISAIKNMQSSFDKSMAKAFTRSIWPRWSYWLNTEGDQIFAKNALIRHMATHLHASFLNEVSSVHPEEHYFIPPLQDRLDTGDIVHREGEYFIIVTPRCDLAREHISTFHLVKLACVKERWNEFLKQKTSGKNNKSKEKGEKQLRNLINHNNRSPKAHFIPQLKLNKNETLGPFHAQFHFMNCLEATDETKLELNKQRIATLSNEFVPSLVERLGAYFSRIGTPDYSHPE